MNVDVFSLRKRSLLRGTVLVLGSLLLAFVLAGFPNDSASMELLIPMALGFLGTWDTGRCLRRRWSLYHGAVFVLLYTDILALGMILFLFFYPFLEPLML